MLRQRSLGLVLFALALAGCGGGGAGVTTPDSNNNTVVNLSGNYTLELRPSVSCSSGVSGQVWSWPVTVTSGPYLNSSRIATIALSSDAKALDFYLVYVSAGAATGTLLTDSPLSVGTGRWLVTTLTATATIVSSGGRGQISNGFMEGELDLGSSGDILAFTADTTCRAADHRFTLHPR